MLEHSTWLHSTSTQQDFGLAELLDAACCPTPSSSAKACCFACTREERYRRRSLHSVAAVTARPHRLTSSDCTTGHVNPRRA
eukprot:1162138-Pelagomonas_calceolata.AAC.1